MFLGRGALLSLTHRTIVDQHRPDGAGCLLPSLTRDEMDVDRAHRRLPCHRRHRDTAQWFFAKEEGIARDHICSATHGCRGILVAVSATACSARATPSPAGSGAPASPASGRPPSSPRPLRHVNIDGSSTVYPITEAVAEEFQKANAGVKVTVGFAGTGGGFKKFCNGETDMNDASRPIKADDAGEGVACKAKGIEWLELGIATDALSVVVSKDNTFVTCLTTAQLKTMWDQGSTAKSWKDSTRRSPMSR